MDKNMGTGATRLTKLTFNIVMEDPFLDSYEQEVVASHDIIDKLKLINGDSINITFSKVFLNKILHSHLKYIRSMDAR